MMGRDPGRQEKLFITNFTLESRVRKDHVLRKVAATIDFDFIYDEVKDSYGNNGNVSVPPAVILKMLLLLVLYNVRSERELMATIPERLDWLWFLGYDLESEVPHHSVLSKARTRWGVTAFKHFFERIVYQCMEAGLVDGKKLFVDASLIDADASNNSVVDIKNLKERLSKGYKHLEERLDQIQDKKRTPCDSRYISGTDPDASVIRRGSGKSKPRYKTHRGVDPANEVITATQVTPGAVDDAHVLQDLIAKHEQNTQQEVQTLVADSKYGTMENYLDCHDRDINAHMPSLEKVRRGSGSQKGIFPKEAFIYEPDTDTFLCPAGHRLYRRGRNRKKHFHLYKTSRGLCAACELRDQCTRAKKGRVLKRHERQHDIDLMVERAETLKAKRDIKTRQHLSERSFARSTRYGYKRARWRRLWRMQIQDYLIAAVQNIITLTTRSSRKLSKSNALKKARPWGAALDLRGFMVPSREILTRFVGYMRQSFARI